ncbi:hypothetical protein PGTUg99_034373 [Puccinia graminis f. sp. tritici]|uniref:Uncharacterized protein n=1 Tax=Puccinia graminis f. sp. tritici TaxID=56615 RepID=A0A5B0P2S9_PUCGR|nr:hypothetical protein PGTUg99_034373 [Puccinia graminis f. sp. tritici]
MSTTSQSENESRSPVRTTPSTRGNHSSIASRSSHRTRPYSAALPRDRGGRPALSSSNGQAPEGLTDPESPPAERQATLGRQFGRPGAGVASTWPPNIVPFETSEANIDEQYLDNLSQTWDLRAPYIDFAEDLMRVPLNRQYSVLLYLVLSVRQAVESLIRSRDTGHHGSSAPAAIPLSVQAHIYPYQNHFKVS